MCLLCLAILWTAIAIANIVAYCNGIAPSWLDVFCPLTVVVLCAWCAWYMDYTHKRKK